MKGAANRDERGRAVDFLGKKFRYKCQVRIFLKGEPQPFSPLSDDLDSNLFPLSDDLDNNLFPLSDDLDNNLFLISS